MKDVDCEYVKAARRFLHENPELSGREFECAAYIERELDAFGVEHRRMGETGVLGTLCGKKGSKGGETVLLRADIDALPIREETGAVYSSRNPGVAHACGHDAHTAALLGAAKALANSREEFGGTVLFVFQQAEELGHGSQYFPGVADGAWRVFGVHVSSLLPVGRVGVNRGAVAAACDYFKITVRGKSAHITRPNEGADALYIAAKIAAEAPAIPVRVTDPFETALVGVGKLTAGTAYNVVADCAVIEGSIRSFSPTTQILLKDAVERLAIGTAALNGGSAEIFFDHGADAIINDDEAVGEVLAAVEAVLGKGGAVVLDKPGLGLGADDFSFFLQNAKGVYALVGTANDVNPNTREPIHSPRFDVDEEAACIAAKLHTRVAMDALSGE